MSLYNRASFPYLSTARAAHDMADLLKRVRPELRGDVAVLQCIVTHSHQRLDEENISSTEIAEAWSNLSAAYQALLDMKHQHKV